MGHYSDTVPRGVPLSGSDIHLEAFELCRELCVRYQFLPTYSDGLLMQVAMVDPANERAYIELRNFTHQEVRAFGITDDDFEKALAWLLSKPSQVEEIKVELSNERPKSWSHYTISRELVLEIVTIAFRLGASDIFIDQQELWTEVAMTVAAQKEILPPLSKENGSAVLKAFKEMSGITTQQYTTWLSGFARCRVDQSWAELRVEITPTLHGESLVARIQNRALQLQRMRRLPFTNAEQTRNVLACLAQSQGLILATGPTGHGKTTTLYACLGQLDRSKLNIRTLEDPVEFAVPWITQIPVGSGTTRSYADGLKSLLRQAPHVILMGEIRDNEVAQTCVEAVDTGHLILATLHARDAIGVVSRLMDLGLSGNAIARSLTLIISQRLMRSLCVQCKQKVKTSELQARHYVRYNLAVPEFLWVSCGCKSCGGVGEKGVVPVFEIIRPSVHLGLNAELRKVTRLAYDEEKLRGIWLRTGGVPLIKEALMRAAQGEIGYTEVIKYEYANL
jgi:type IV pilus assembly protein PilB